MTQVSQFTIQSRIFTQKHRHQMRKPTVSSLPRSYHPLAALHSPQSHLPTGTLLHRTVMEINTMGLCDLETIKELS